MTTFAVFFIQQLKSFNLSMFVFFLFLLCSKMDAHEIRGRSFSRIGSFTKQAHTSHKSLAQKPNRVVLSSKKIEIPGFPQAFNPSIVRTEKGILLCFRECPNRFLPCISHIGVVLLNEAL